MRTTDDDFFFSRGDQYNIFGVDRDTPRILHTYTAQQSFSSHNNIYYYDTGTTIDYDTNTHIPTHTHNVTSSSSREPNAEDFTHTTREIKFEKFKIECNKILTKKIVFLNGPFQL